MQLDTLREPFLRHLQLAASFAPTRSPRPILHDVVLSVQGDTVTLMSSDGEVSLRTSFSGEQVKGSGTAALPAHTLLGAVRGMPSEELSVREEGAQHVFSGGPAVFKLHGDDPSLFPAVPESAGSGSGTGVDVPLAGFLDLVARTAFAAARDMGRFAFNGVLVELDADGVVLVATDGRRLSKASLACATGLTGAVKAIVPARALAQLQKAAAEGEGPGDGERVLRIEAGEDRIGFRIGRTHITAQLLEGEFPNYRAVLPAPKDTPNCARIHRQDLADAIQRAAVTAGDTGRSVEFALEPGQLRITSRHEGVGESRSELEVDYTGSPCTVRFNPDFLHEYLRTVPEDSLEFRFRDRASAGAFSSTAGTMYVVMPITS